MRKLLPPFSFVLLAIVLTACNLEGIAPEVSFDKEQALQMAFDIPEIEAAKNYIEASGEQLLIEEATFTVSDRARSDNSVVHRKSTLLMSSSDMTYELGVVFDSERQIFESYLIEFLPLDSGEFRSTYTDILIGEVSTTIFDAKGTMVDKGSVREFAGFAALSGASLSLAAQASSGRVLNTEAQLENLAEKYGIPLPNGHCTPHPLYCPPHDHPDDPDDGGNSKCDRESKRVSEKRRDYNDAKADRDSKDRTAGGDRLDLLYWEQEVKYARNQVRIAQGIFNFWCPVKNPLVNCDGLERNLERAREDLQRAEDRAEAADEDYERSREALEKAEAEVVRAKDELDEAKKALENCKD